MLQHGSTLGALLIPRKCGFRPLGAGGADSDLTPMATESAGAVGQVPVLIGVGSSATPTFLLSRHSTEPPPMAQNDSPGAGVSNENQLPFDRIGKSRYRAQAKTKVATDIA